MELYHIIERMHEKKGRAPAGALSGNSSRECSSSMFPPPVMPELPSNPFATRYIRPGATPYLYGDFSREDLVSRFGELGHRCQILGPHGSGKSSLMLDLLPSLQDRFACRARHVVFPESPRSEQSRRLRGILWNLTVGESATDNHDQCRVQVIRDRPGQAGWRLLLAVDGFEQLNRLSRWMLKTVSRLTRTSLLVTTHGDIGLPTLATTQVDYVKARQIIANLLGGRAQVDALINDEELQEQLDARDGNLREVLFWLYDRWAERPRHGAG